MLPLLAIPTIFSTVGKIASSGLNLAAKSADTATDAAQATAEMVVDKDGKEHAADSPKGKMIINMKKEEEAPEMFGGMDLNKIKSALDEDSPLGMPEEVKGGVYKQIFEVNKMMLGSLQRIEGTLKLMLNLEYERALGFQQADVQQNLIEGDTDPVPDPDDPDPKSGPGRFRKMLGGAYTKAKGGLTGTIAKMLGLGALVFAFRSYREEIIGAMAKVLEWFKSAYDYFTADDFSFGKLKDDFMNKWMPKLYETIRNILMEVYNYVKSALGFGTGDVAVSKAESKRQGFFAATMSPVGEDSIKEGEVPGTFEKVTNKDIGRFLNSSRDPDERTSDVLSKGQQSKVTKNFNEYLGTLLDISYASKSRIQWKGIDTDMGDKGLYSRWGSDPDAWRFMLGINASPVEILNATPIIDGLDASWESLSGINLMEVGGMNMNMSQTQRDTIEELLAQKSLAAATLSTPNDYTNFEILGKDLGFGANAMMEKKLSGAKEDFDAADYQLQGLQDFTNILDDLDFSYNGNKSGQKLSVADEIRLEKIRKRTNMPGGSVSAYYDNKSSTNINAPEINNMSLSANPTSNSVLASRNAQLQDILSIA